MMYTIVNGQQGVSQAGEQPPSVMTTINTFMNIS